MTLRAFMLASLVYGAPMIPLGLAFTAWGLAPPPAPFDGTLRGALRAWLDAALFAPLAETALLMWCVALASSALSSHVRICLAGALPIVLAHVFNGGWPKVIVVLWPFLWSAHCNLVLREQGVRPRGRFAFLFGMHALWNGLVTSLFLATT